MKSALLRLAFAGLGLVVALGCRTTKPTPVPSESPRPQVTRLDYVESEAFDLVFETALVNAQPVIVIQTDFAKPEWGTRLNEWIAAWNAGRRPQGLRVRGQIPAVPSVVVDGDSIREFRLLIDGLMGRVEESVRVGGNWWATQSMRERRIALLRPYSLRFHLDANERIQVIFFHGDYATQHKDIVRSLVDPVGEETLEWSSGYCCSRTRERPKRTATTN